MEIQITLQKEDWRLYQRYIEKALPKHLKTWKGSFWTNILIWMITAYLFLLLFNRFSSFHSPTAISVGTLFILIFFLSIVNMYKTRVAFEPSDSGIFCGNHVFKFDPDGITAEGRGYKGDYSWEVVMKIERIQGMILIYLDSAQAFVFPEAKLDDPDNFYSYVLDCYSNNKNSQNH